MTVTSDPGEEPGDFNQVQLYDDEVDTTYDDVDTDSESGIEYKPNEDFNIPPSESIAKQKLMMLMQRISAPDIEIPYRDYSQKDDPEEDRDNPNLSLFCHRLSVAAAEAWQKMVEELDEGQILRLLLSNEELKEYEEYQQIVKQEDDDYLESENVRVNRRCNETTGFRKTVAPDLSDRPYNITFDEFTFRKVVSDYQTNKWRVPYTPPQSDLGFLDPRHDPDFLPPCSVTKGFLIKPANRPYNLTFFVTFCDQNGVVREEIRKPESKKDYTTVEDMTYLLVSQRYRDIQVKDITPSGEVKWEMDLRLSPRNQAIDGEESLIPNPRNYKKIDPDSPLGRRLVRSLKENPYHEWIEVGWDHEGADGSNERKVALVRTGGDKIAWCYVDRSSLAPTFKRKRVTYPQTQPILNRHADGNEFIVGYTVRYQDYNELDKPYNFLVKRELDAIVNRLRLAGILPVSLTTHDNFGCRVLTLIDQKYQTPKQRYLARKKARYD
jgi:hypothetical protein